MIFLCSKRIIFQSVFALALCSGFTLSAFFKTDYNHCTGRMKTENPSATQKNPPFVLSEPFHPETTC